MTEGLNPGPLYYKASVLPSGAQWQIYPHHVFCFYGPCIDSTPLKCLDNRKVFKMQKLSFLAVVQLLKWKTKNKILANLLHPTDSVRNLGVCFDAVFFFENHVCSICKSYLVQMILSTFTQISFCNELYFCFYGLCINSNLSKCLYNRNVFIMWK